MGIVQRSLIGLFNFGNDLRNAIGTKEGRAFGAFDLAHLFGHMGALVQQAQQLFVQRIDLHDNGGYLAFTAKPTIDPMTVIQLIQRNPKTYAMQGSDRLKITNKTEDGVQRAMFLRALLAQLGAC